MQNVRCTYFNRPLPVVPEIYPTNPWLTRYPPDPDRVGRVTGKAYFHTSHHYCIDNWPPHAQHLASCVSCGDSSAVPVAPKASFTRIARVWVQSFRITERNAKRTKAHSPLEIMSKLNHTSGVSSSDSLLQRNPRWSKQKAIGLLLQWLKVATDAVIT